MPDESPVVETDSPHFGYVRALGMSLYSPEIYRDVVLRWRGLGFGFILFLVAVCMVPPSIWFQVKVSKAVDLFEKRAPEVPVIRIEKGTASVDAPQPCYLFKEDLAPSMIVVLDTTGAVTQLDQNGVILGKTDLRYFDRRKGETRIYPLDKIGNWTIDQVHLKNWAEAVRVSAGILAYWVMLLCFYTYKILAVLVWALVILGLAQILGVTLDYVQGVRLAALLQAPAYMLSLALFLVGVHPKHAFGLYWLLTLGYMFYAVRSLKDSEPTEGAVQP